MEAASRIYMAGVLAGIRSWVDASQVMADTAWNYYYQALDDGESPDAAAVGGGVRWKERIEDNVRTYLRNLENLQIQFQADFERRAFGIIDSVFGTEPQPEAERKGNG